MLLRQYQEEKKKPISSLISLCTLPASSHLLSPSVRVRSETKSWLSPPGNGSLFLPLPKAAGRASPNPATPLAQPSLPGALLEPQSKTRCLGSRQPYGWDGTGRDGMEQRLRSHPGRGPAAAPSAHAAEQQRLQPLQRLAQIQLLLSLTTSAEVITRSGECLKHIVSC